MKRIWKQVGIAALCIVVAYLVAWWSLNETVQYSDRRPPVGAKLALLSVAKVFHTAHLRTVFVLTGFKMSLSAPRALPWFYATPCLHGLLLYGIGIALFKTVKRKRTQQPHGEATSKSAPEGASSEASHA
ncbi:hypothetical protein BVX97_04985 [bacterium E08(2017)]|nr:hypothetical protein BVX97_04985 [bacterium E08(2017)]